MTSILTPGLLGFLLLAPANIVLPGLSLPAEFSRNATLSVAGQEVYEHIHAGERNLVAITPHVRPRSVEILLRSGYRDWCRIKDGPFRRVLFHRSASGMIWFVIGRKLTAHIVLANGSQHREHFEALINEHCSN